MRDILVICGPTGCGKTDFAHRIASRNKGEIVNCDSMQIYSEIPILTASPSNVLKSEVLYHLYNFQSVILEFSVAKYTAMAANVINQIISRGNLPILVGGTGMYISALLYGYNDIPEISKKIREESRLLHTNIGQEKFFKLLSSLDNLGSAKINPQDTQRSLRAFEVFKQTGKSIFTYQNQDNILPLGNLNFKIIFLNPARELLYDICDRRLINIFNEGAIKEVKNIKNNFSALQTPAAKAIGVCELLSYLNGECSLDDALKTAQKRTRNYAKRQVTWFKHQLKEKDVLEYANLKEFNQLKDDFSLSGD